MLKSITDKPRILYVFGGEKAQGAEIVIERLMYYNNEKVNTHLILSPGDFATALIENEKPYKITLFENLRKLNRSSSGKLNYALGALKNYITVPVKVHWYIRRNKISIIHANTGVPASYLLPLVLYSRIFMPSLRWYWSDHDLKYFSRLDRLLSLLCVRLFNFTLVVSEAVKRKYAVNPKVIVLYNGLDLNIFKPHITEKRLFRSEHNIREDTIVIGLAASINPDKGQLALINVFKKLNENFKDIKLVIAGGFAGHFPEYGNEVRRAIASNDNIIYAGFVTWMINFYNGCDIIVNNSNDYRSESLGTTIYEAMSCENIVVASDTGGTPEIVADKIDGFLFEADNEQALFDKLDYLLKNYPALIDIQKAARRKVERKFNIITMINKYNAILNI